MSCESAEPSSTGWDQLTGRRRITVSIVMRHAIIHHVAGNLAALTDIERQFAADVYAGVVVVIFLGRRDAVTDENKLGINTDLGRLAPGFEADLVVLNGDPSKDIRALTSVQHTLRSGEIIYSTSKVLG